MDNKPFRQGTIDQFIHARPTHTAPPGGGPAA